MGLKSFLNRYGLQLVFHWVSKLTHLTIGDWRRARFRKVATLKPGGLFKHYDLHKAASLEVSLVKKDALGLHLFKKLPNH